MKIVAVSDMHGNLKSVHEILEKENPDLLLCAGDWGSPEAVSKKDIYEIVQKVTTFTVFGNHDHLEVLDEIKNKDGTAILIANGTTTCYETLVIGGINGIWAKSHKKAWYITDEEVAIAAQELAGTKVDILLTHGCPFEIAGLTPIGTRGGQRCFTDAFKVVDPTLYVCGHLHYKCSHQTQNGNLALNVGFTSAGDYSVFYFENDAFKHESGVI